MGVYAGQLHCRLLAVLCNEVTVAEKNIRITVEYEGTAYAGWQIQTDQKTIQGELIEAIYRVTGKRVPLVGAGRTDAGVHGLGQVANFHIDHSLEPERYREAINFYLPDEILVKESAEVPLDFHARNDARFRRYRYLIGSERSAVYRNFRWYRDGLDFSLLKDAAELIVGEHDFSPFCVVSSRKENNVCWIDHSHWRKVGKLLVFEIRGNRFLHNMVRSLVGGMANLASKGKDRNPENLTLPRFRDILDNPREKRVVFTAPACGLYLVSVGY
jgi:tRNA pseudouridine38-40 synthase